jgi:dihydroxyacetone kinase
MSQPTPAEPRSITPATPASRALARQVITALEVAAHTMAEHADELGRIDAVAGDGDHGIGMTRGTTAALEGARAAATRGAGAGSTLEWAGTAWADKAGGTSGALWGAALKAAGARLGDIEAADETALRDALVAAVDRIAELGGAEVGDKTMIDALVPFRDRLRAPDERPLRERLADAADDARLAAESTASLRPRLGRARPLAERSLGTPDAGATSAALLIRAVLDAF